MPNNVDYRKLHFWEKQEGKCYYCGEKLDWGEYVSSPNEKKPMQIDHKLPRSKGGTGEMDNLCLVCCQCNRSKSGRTEEEFVLYLQPYLWGFVSRMELSDFNLYLRLGNKYTEAEKLYSKKKLEENTVID